MEKDGREMDGWERNGLMGEDGRDMDGWERKGRVNSWDRCEWMEENESMVKDGWMVRDK